MVGLIIFGIALIILLLGLFVCLVDGKSNFVEITEAICNYKERRDKIKAETEITIAKMQLDNQIRLRDWLDKPLENSK